MSQNVFQKFTITDILPFQQKTTGCIDALLSGKHVYLSVKTIVGYQRFISFHFTYYVRQKSINMKRELKCIILIIATYIICSTILVYFSYV